MTLWAITSYWNAAGFARRLKNYRTFRENLNAPLLTVELSFSDEFELASPDADELIQIKGRSVLWQKERLLNIAAQALPDSCENVAWLDSDILFDDRDWSSRANKALQHNKLVQLFDRVGALGKGARSGEARDTEIGELVESTLSAAIAGREVASGLRYPKPWSLGQTANGLAWAARREFFDAAALYDACILGSGDRALVCAALGVPEIVLSALSLSPEHARHYLSWATRFSEWLDSRYACLAGTIFHLWHGHPKKRRIEDRYEGLRPFQFDPHRDIGLDSSQAWVWATDKKAMHDYTSRYFFSRMEDE
jgi:hypothetical protein